MKSKKAYWATILGAIAALGPSIPADAAGFCMEPRAPSFFGSKPNKPYCAISRNCSQWEVNNYKSQVQSHFNQLQQYANDVNRYQRQASEYIECMSDLD